ncbi:MAG: 23S rRNA (adenine(2030)-N(6))-methyltransferase RlmJ [Wenzhouxiangellaceae bacterium]|nr:23S rRNA (adenine(2030)-N(6))-methyltransferase RlmJ [Wenzhouxiangellaceae bacterium]
MLSYRHGFHAGNPADVFKHAVLIALLRAMQTKDKGIRFVDTHAGAAMYALNHEFAQKNREFERGVGAVWNAHALPEPLVDYLAAIRHHNPDGQLQRYPGSPQLLHDLQRPQDELVICELHPTEQRVLRAHFGHTRDVRIHAGDGYAALEQWLPPPTGRALVLIDPPFELKSELDDLGNALERALKRCAHAVIAIWYPVIDGRNTTPDALPERLGLDGERWLDLRIDFSASQQMGRMTGCGMAIVNCPYRARDALTTLHASFNTHDGELTPAPA